MSKTMKLALIEEMVTNYKNKQYLSIVTNKVNPMTFDAQSVWFDINELKSMIASIETETAKHPSYNMHDFGIRLYYAAYPEGRKWEEPGYEDIAALPTNYEKLHTVVGIPTARIKGVNTDFDPYDINTYTGVKPQGIGLSIMAENHGDLTPPNSANGHWF